MEQHYTKRKCSTLFKVLHFLRLCSILHDIGFFLHSVLWWQVKLHVKSQVSLYCFRCRIPECEGTEATFNPDWLQNAVPFHQHDARSVPRRCLRFASRNSSLLRDDTERNVTSCSPESFDNRSVFRCDEWVYDGDETTVLREVR